MIENSATTHSIPIDDSLDPAVVDSPGPHSHIEAVARLAHQYWEERGQAHGHDVEDWLRAEHEVTEQERKESDTKSSTAASR